MSEWINEMWYTHTVEYYSALRRKGILSYASTWMLCYVMLSETSQSGKDKTVGFHVYEVHRIVKLRDRW